MKRHGLTIIELLVVITLIGVLSAAITVFINPVKRQKQARDARRKQDITSIATALASYSTLKGHSPAENLCDSSIGETNATPDCHQVQPDWFFNWENDWDDWIYRDLITDSDLIKKLPIDPINNTTYFYSYEPAPNDLSSGLCNNSTTGCGSYWIGALLEAPENPAKAIYRCSDNSQLTDGVGCKEVDGVSMPTSEIVL